MRRGNKNTYRSHRMELSKVVAFGAILLIILVSAGHTLA